MEQIQKLLESVSGIINENKKEQHRKIQCGEDTGSQFNIFEILSIGTREVYMCRVLAELLNPNGLHCQGTKYLDLFCNRFLYEKEINTENVIVRTEDLTKNLDEIGKENRRIDIVIDEKDGNYIPIEVKINAYEQQEQCQDYLNSARKIYKKRKKNEDDAIIIYLTKLGEMPSSIYNEKDKEKVKCITWCQICDWLNECICQIDTIRKIPITEILMQYRTTIEQFIEEKNDMNQQIINKIKESAENFDSAEQIADNFDIAKREIVKKLFDEIEKRFKETFADDLKNEDNVETDEKLFRRDSDKIVYTNNYSPDKENIAEYNVVFFERGKIYRTKIKYRDKKIDGSGWVSENKQEKVIIQFKNIIQNLNDVVDDCYNFLIS